MILLRQFGSIWLESNFAKQYPLEIDIRAFQQKSMSGQEFFNTTIDVCDQLVLTKFLDLQAFTPCITRREEHILVQFFMVLRDDFEGLRRTILFHIIFLMLILLTGEIHFKSHVDRDCSTI